MLNMSPIRYLATWRLHLAAQALREGSNPIAAIADEVGYESEEGFSWAFAAASNSDSTTPAYHI
jgi:AraC-like DNA-binding protein